MKACQLMKWNEVWLSPSTYVLIMQYVVLILLCIIERAHIYRDWWISIELRICKCAGGVCKSYTCIFFACVCWCMHRNQCIWYNVCVSVCVWLWVLWDTHQRFCKRTVSSWNCACFTGIWKHEITIDQKRLLEYVMRGRRINDIGHACICLIIHINSCAGSVC